MKKLEKILKKTKNGLNQFGYFLKNHSSGCSAGLILLAFIGAGLVYYFYVLNTTLPSKEQPIEIKIQLYKKTLEQQKNLERAAQEKLNQNYPDIFK